MTIHQPGSPTYAWRCPACGEHDFGYPCASAAVRAEARRTANRCTRTPDAGVTR